MHQELVTDEGKVYKIANQAKVLPQAGKKVTLSGKLQGFSPPASLVE